MSSPLFSTLAGISNNNNARKQLTGYRDAAQGLTNQANSNYYGDLYPNERAQSQRLFDSGGYTSGEQSQMYLTPEEQQSQYYSPGEQSSMYLSPEEQNAMRISSTDATGIRNLALSPISGAATRAQQQLTMSAASRGGYAPGANAAAEEVQREQGRQAGETALSTNLGIAGYNRNANAQIAAQRLDAARNIANQRTGVAANQGYFRTGQAGLIGQARQTQQIQGAQLTAQQAALESQRQLYGLNQWGGAARSLAGVPTTTGQIYNGAGQAVSGLAQAFTKKP